jgi:3-deoxy-D-manno-octulosonic acid kinase
MSAESPGGVLRMRVDGYACRMAYTLTVAEVRNLLDAIGAPGLAGPGVLGGRGVVWLHDIPSIGSVVIKEYRRGGILRHFMRRHYLRGGRTRPEREFDILSRAHAVGLDVPEPIACLTRGAMYYRGWLVTRLIEGRSLVEVAQNTEALAPLMDAFARQVRLLVEHRIAHVDLHPGNVLVDGVGGLHVIDFDKATLFSGPLDELRESYLVRWHRAVVKHGLPAILSERLAAGLQGPLDARAI